jgi:hypothetical protein
MLVWKDVAQMEGHGKKSRRSFGKMWMEMLDWKFTSIKWQWLKKEKISLECLLWNLQKVHGHYILFISLISTLQVLMTDGHWKLYLKP